MNLNLEYKNIGARHGAGLTPGETEKSIDLHKVSGGFGIAIQVETWEEIEILKCCCEYKIFVSMNLKCLCEYKSRQYLQARSGTLVGPFKVSSHLDNIGCEGILHTF